MGLLGNIVGGALNIGGSIFGGIKASKAMKKVKRNINNQLRDNQNWYDRRYNEDATQRADAQRILTMTQDAIRKRNQATAGAQAVMGGTEESAAAARAANNEVLADATSQIAVAGDVRKDNIESQYMATKADLNNQLNALEQNKAAEIAKGVNGVTGTASELVKLFNK